MKKNYLNIGVVYFLGQVFIKGISFLLIPLYTRYLGASIYGELAIVDLLLGIFGVFSVYRIYSGCYRFYNDLDSNKLISTAFIFSLFSTVVQGIIVFLIFYLLANKILEIKYAVLIVILAWIRASIQEIIILLKTKFSMEYLVKKVFFMNLITTALSLCLIIYFVTKKDMQIVGIYLGYILGNLPIFIYLIWSNKNILSLGFDKKIFKKLFYYGFGLIFGDISYLLLSMIDRFFLKIYTNLSDVGVYSLGYKFGGLIEAFFIYSFMEIFSPFKYKNYKKNNFEEEINKFYFYYHLMGILFILIISFNVKLILYLFTTEEFIIAYKVVPLILYSYLLYGQSNFYKTGLQLKSKTHIDSVVIFIGCFINIGLNFYLIKKFGMIGAAISTIISYIVMNILYYILSNIYLKIKYRISQMLQMIILSLCLYCIYYYVSILNINIWYQTILGNLLLLLYITVEWLFIIKKEEKLEIKNYLQNFIKKIVHR